MRPRFIVAPAAVVVAIWGISACRPKEGTLGGDCHPALNCSRDPTCDGDLLCAGDTCVVDSRQREPTTMDGCLPSPITAAACGPPSTSVDCHHASVSAGLACERVADDGDDHTYCCLPRPGCFENAAEVMNGVICRVGQRMIDCVGGATPELDAGACVHAETRNDAEKYCCATLAVDRDD